MSQRNINHRKNKNEGVDNLEQMIQHNENILKMKTKEASPVDWAVIQYNLGVAYTKRIKGVRAENLEQAIHHYKQALDVYTRKKFPEQWAKIQNSLGITYYFRIRGVRADNFELGIHHCKQALIIYVHETFPEDWALTYHNLGLINAKRIRGVRADNLERAIHYHNQALKVYTREDFPADWAMIQLSLGNAYGDRIRDERAENLEQAIHHHKQALEVYTRKNFPEQWATTQYNLGTVYYDRICGMRANNLERAIHYHNQALEVYTREDFPADWAMIQLSLGNAYGDRIRDERAENLEKAIHHYKQALEVYTRKNFPEQWASTQNSLGITYYFRIRGVRADNFELGIHHCKQALIVYVHETFPEDWALTQHNLGLIYGDRIRGEQAKNLELAIHHYNQALEVYTSEAFPADWAMTQINLGLAYNDRIRGERAKNLELAIHHYKQALEVYTRKSYPEQWAAAQHNLGFAHAYRILGERVENLEQAIFYNNQSLEVYTFEAYPEDWAMVQNSLGTVYHDRIGGGRAENLEKAIHHYEQALKVYSDETYPFDWAMIQNNLGLAYANRIRGEQIENLEQAIHNYKQALKVYTCEDFPTDWAMIQLNLGGIYVNRIQGERKENLERAIYHYEQALKMYTYESHPTDWAAIQDSLGLTYTYRIQGERKENLERAIYHYKQALKIRTLTEFPSEYRQTLNNLGDLYFNERNWNEAFLAYEKAIKAGDLLLAAAYTETGRRFEVSTTAILYARTAYALLQMKKLSKALVTIEQGKSRLLDEALALNDNDLTLLPDLHQRTMLKARQTVRELEAEMRLSSSTPARRDDRELASLLHQARADLNQIVYDIRKENPTFLPHKLGFKDILSVIPKDGALVAMLVTIQGSVVYVIPSGVKTIKSEHLIRQAEFTRNDLLELLQGSEENIRWGGWFGAYFTFNVNPTKETLGKWQNAIKKYTKQLWNKLIEAIHKKLVDLGLPNGSPVIILPQGGLGVLPLHAAWRQLNEEMCTFLDSYTITYAPSAYTLHISYQRLRDQYRHNLSLLAVINPTGDLHYANIEGSGIMASFPPTKQYFLTESEAMKEDVMTYATRCSYLHFCCHGFYDWQDTMHSGLLLASRLPNKSDPFTLAEIISGLDLSVSRLVILSACETGISEYRQSPDEYIGIPAGFLLAGAPTVICSLWAVDDLSTALLMTYFYYMHIKKDLQPSQALRAAQLWLRKEVDVRLVIEYIQSFLSNLENQRSQMLPWSEEEWFIDQQIAQLKTQYRYFCKKEKQDPKWKPFEHPYYWGAFIISGADKQTNEESFKLMLDN
ncbi:MAG: CHAT domain-containing protein [Candidatus Hodarchaeota archaeon]